jgi:hypothetical protein
LDYQYILKKMKGKKVGTPRAAVEIPVGRGKHKGRVNEGEYGGRIFVFIYENKRE